MVDTIDFVDDSALEGDEKRLYMREAGDFSAFCSARAADRILSGELASYPDAPKDDGWIPTRLPREKLLDYCGPVRRRKGSKRN